MTPEQAKQLQVGDIVRYVADKARFVVVSKDQDDDVVVASQRRGSEIRDVDFVTELTHPENWELVSRVVTRENVIREV